MRRVKEKKPLYMKIAKSPRLTPFRSSSQSTPMTPKPSHARKSSDSTNFLRFGTPSDTIVHVPLSVARFNEKARRDLTRFHCDFERLLHKRQLKRDPPTLENKEEYLSAINSVNVPIASFAQVAHGRLTFCISPSDLTDSDRVRLDVRRIKSQSDLHLPLGREAEKCKASFRESVEAIHRFSGGAVETMKRDATFAVFGNERAQSFFEAVKTGDLLLVEQFLAADKRLLHVKDAVGQTSLHWAAKRNDLALAKLLKSVGADVNATDIACRTPLFIAARKDFTDMVLLLLEAGANRRVVSLNGTTAGDVAKEGSVVWMVLNRRGLSNNLMASVVELRKRKSHLDTQKAGPSPEAGS